jgi:hypothetical protein
MCRKYIKKCDVKADVKFYIPTNMFKLSYMAACPRISWKNAGPFLDQAAERF